MCHVYSFSAELPACQLISAVLMLNSLKNHQKNTITSCTGDCFQFHSIQNLEREEKEMKETKIKELGGRKKTILPAQRKTKNRQRSRIRHMQSRSLVIYADFRSIHSSALEVKTTRLRKAPVYRQCQFWQQ